MKRFRWDKKYLHWGVTAFLVIAASILFYLIVSNLGWLGGALKRLGEILSPFVWGLVFAYLLFPLLKIYSRHLFTPLSRWLFRKHPRKDELVPKLARGLSVFLCIVTLLLILGGLIMLVTPQLYLSIERLVVNSSAYVDQADAFIQRTLTDYPELESTLRGAVGNLNDGLVKWATDNLLPEMKGLIGNVASNVVSILKGIYNIIIGIVVSAYVLYDKEGFAGRCKKIVYCIFSMEAAEQILKSVQFTNQVFMSYISGKILDSLLVGLICYICCLIFNIPYAILASSVVFVSNMIPFFGPIIGGVIGTLFILMESPLKALIFGVIVIILQQFDGNVLGPRILGDRVGVKGFWIMFSIILGAGLFGFGGMLLGVPVFVVIYAFFRGLVNRKLARSGLTQETEVYSEMSHFDPQTGEPMPFTEPEPLQKKQKRRKKDKGQEESNK